MPSLSEFSDTIFSILSSQRWTNPKTKQAKATTVTSVLTATCLQWLPILCDQPVHNCGAGGHISLLKKEE
jgi:hypothetical protein